MRNRTVTLLGILIFVLVTGMVRAQQTVSLGGAGGWHDARLDGLIQVTGRHGDGDLAIMPFRNEANPDTEILLHFDSLPLADDAGGVSVSAVQPELSPTTRRSGAAALLVDGPGNGISLLPAARGLFSPGVEWGDFTLEFWLYPATVSEGERILEWSGREGIDLDFRSQKILVDIHDRRLRFSFVNFFQPPDRAPVTVSLHGADGLIPRSWSHHRIVFSAATGRLEYLVDGVPAAVTHASDSHTQDGTIHFPRIAEFPPEALSLAPSFTGAIDEFRLTRALETAPVSMDMGSRWYPEGGGAYESPVVNLGSPGAVLTGIEPVGATPGHSDIFLYVRVADRHIGGRNVVGDWVPVDPMLPFEPTTGQFVQVRAELLPDPGIEASPRLTEIVLTYAPDTPPYPPVGVTAQPGDGEVELSWAPVLQPDIRGYIVYYGTQPGRYFGAGADGGPSPVDVGPATAITLSGLENGTLYYFAVSAYDAAGTTSETELSAEAVARPARVYR